MHELTSPNLTVVVPVYNEAGNIERLLPRIEGALEGRFDYEVLFVDDGSQDNSWDILQKSFEQDERVRAVRFVRNFGQQMALSAGLAYARGQTVVLIDADLQTQPEDIPRLVEKLAEGYDIVYGVRRHRKDPLYRRLGSWAVSLALSKLTKLDIPDSSTGFIALDRRLVEHTKLFCDKTKYYSGIFAYLSYGRWASLPVDHCERSAGTSSYGFFKLVRLTLDFFCNHTDIPLRIATYLSFPCGLLGFALLVAGLAARVLQFLGRTDAYLLILLGALLAMGSLLLFSLGMLGEYVGRIYTEVKERPPYVVSEVLERSDEEEGTGG